ncbi:MAG: hypothetical protein IKY43_06050 [Bacteroidales bacterium]|nr:hypothetical protein [Bacteroidales bacterium]
MNIYSKIGFKSIGVLLFVMVFLCFGCSDKQSVRSIDPRKVNFEVSYDVNFDGIMYPSLIMGMANYNGKSESDFFSYKVTSPKNNSVLRIVMDSSLMNYVTIFQTILPEKGKTYMFYPLVKWKYDNLIRLKQPGKVDLTFTCYINDEEVDVKNMRLNYRTINECLLGIRDTANNYIDYRWMFAAFVNEEHPWLDVMLNRILEQNVVNRFVGYQLGEKEVLNQVFAIWYFIQTKGIKYSSISNTSKYSKKVNSQYIRFFDEVYRNQQANCIDACAFMASILKKIGLNPIIFVEPKHAYLGFYKDTNKKKLVLLETTLAGNVDLLSIDDRLDTITGMLSEEDLKIYEKYLTAKDMEAYKNGRMSLEKLKQTISRSNFNNAINYNIERYNKNKKYFANTNNDRYQKLVIKELRELVQPIRSISERYPLKVLSMQDVAIQRRYDGETRLNELSM